MPKITKWEGASNIEVKKRTGRHVEGVWSPQDVEPEPELEVQDVEPEPEPKRVRGAGREHPKAK